MEPKRGLKKKKKKGLTLKDISIPDLFAGTRFGHKSVVPAQSCPGDWKEYLFNLRIIKVFPP